MIKVIKDSEIFEELRKTEMYNTFTRSDHNGKLELLSYVLKNYKEFRNKPPSDHLDFGQKLMKSVGLENVWAMIRSIETGGGYTNRWSTVEDVVNEIENALNDEEYRNSAGKKIEIDEYLYNMYKEEEGKELI
ncbi:hypothetical protein COX58_01210 [archaeon CG_4_10_14_0_2_um_filter_Archaea_38_6]|nr:MAG: hypothetical protein COS83_03490 [archaeon CG07_land_8_20_14_0_80_38_8]PJA22788.1 MAG: hypothetical protein COX58_01210 [archaeon CG_4_10_14_0_2_um_filter_Archaea_38_6]